MKKQQIRFERVIDSAKIPTKAHDSDAGFDVFSCHDAVVGNRRPVVVTTGIKCQLPNGYHVEVRSKSGLAANKGVFVLNSPGTIDNGYRGEWMVTLFCVSPEPHFIRAGDKIAQVMLRKDYNADWCEVDSLNETERGDDGFGSTGR